MFKLDTTGNILLNELNGKVKTEELKPVHNFCQN